MYTEQNIECALNVAVFHCGKLTKLCIHLHSGEKIYVLYYTAWTGENYLILLSKMF